MAFNNIIIKGFKKSFKLIGQGFAAAVAAGAFVKICALNNEPNVCQHLSTEMNIDQKLNVEENVCQHLSTVLNVCQRLNTELDTGQHLSTESGL